MFQEDNEWEVQEDIPVRGQGRRPWDAGGQNRREGLDSWNRTQPYHSTADDPWNARPWPDGGRGRMERSAFGGGDGQNRGRWTNQSTEEQDVYEELRYRVQHGEDLLLRGQPSYPGRIVRALFRERGSYMRDIQTDEEGYIRQINFIRVE